MKSLDRLKDYPKLLLSIKTTAAIAGLSMLVTPLLPYRISVKIAVFLTLLIAVLLLTSYLRLSLARYRPAYFFLISIGALLGASVIYSFKAFGLLPHNFFTENSPLIGSAMEVSLLTFALADRFRELKAQHARMQDEMIALQKDNIRHLDEQVAEKTADIRSIFSTINQGIFTMSGIPPVIDAEKSIALERMFPNAQGVSRNPFTAILQNTSLSTDQIDQIRAAVCSSLDSDILNFEANAGCLPRRFSTIDHNNHTRFFEADWTPILDDKENIKKVLVAIRDATEIRELEIQAQERSKETELMMQILAVPAERFVRFLSGIRLLYQNSKQLLIINDEISGEQLRKVYAFMHTIKGNSRTYGITRLSSGVHELEELIKRLIMKPTDLDKEKLLEEFQKLDQLISEIEDVSIHKLGRSLVNRSVGIVPEDIEQVIDVLSKIELIPLQYDFSREVGKIRQEMLRIRFESLESTLEDTFRSLKRIAEQSGKAAPRIDFKESQGVYIRDEVHNTLLGIFSHIMTNCIDHGLEAPEVRNRLGKPDQGLISVHTYRNELQDLIIMVSDDGAGLNLPKLRNRAIHKNIIPADCVDPILIAETIFMSGMSTADHVTELSGRGVGMDAVRSFIEKLEGMITIEFINNQPSIDRPASFAFRIILPSRYFIFGQNPNMRQVFPASA